MLDRASQFTSFRPNRGLMAVLSLMALFVTLPLSLVQGQTPDKVALRVVTKNLSPSRVAMKHAPPTRRAHVKVSTATAAQDKVNAKSTVAPQGQTISTSVFNLQYATSRNVIDLLNKVFKGDSVRIAADIPGNLIIVRGTKDMVAEVASVIQRIDLPAPEDEAKESARITRIYPLRYATATDIAEILRTTNPPRRGVSVAVDSRTNSLVIVAEQAKLDAIARILSELDRPSDKQLSVEQAEIRIMPLRHANADDVIKLVSSLCKDPGLIKLMTDIRTNSVIVHASPSATEEVARLIAQFDVPTKP